MRLLERPAMLCEAELLGDPEADGALVPGARDPADGTLLALPDERARPRLADLRALSTAAGQHRRLRPDRDPQPRNGEEASQGLHDLPRILLGHVLHLPVLVSLASPGLCGLSEE